MQDFEHILCLPDSLSAFLEMQVTLPNEETDEVQIDELPIDDIPDTTLTDSQLAQIPTTELTKSELGEVPNTDGTISTAAELAKDTVEKLEKENAEKLRLIKNELGRYAFSRLRSVLPLLIGCHSNDPKLVHLCLEGLHHISMTGLCSTLGKQVDPVLDCFLSAIFEGVLACWQNCLQPLMDILMKILGTCNTVPQSSMMCLITVLSSLHELVYRLEDAEYGVRDHVFELFTTSLNSIMSLVQSFSSDSTMTEVEETPNMSEVLTSFASKMESLDVGSTEALSMNILQVSSLLCRELEWQDIVMYLLLLVYHCRKYGRVRIDRRTHS